MSAPHLKAEAQAFKAGADLSTHQYKLVKYGATPQEVALCGNNEKPCGILMNAPKEDEVAEVAIAGGFKVKVASTVSAGESCASAANGIGEEAAAGDWAIGIFQDDGVSGDIVPVQIDLHQLDKDVS